MDKKDKDFFKKSNFKSKFINLFSEFFLKIKEFHKIKILIYISILLFIILVILSLFNFFDYYFLLKKKHKVFELKDDFNVRVFIKNEIIYNENEQADIEKVVNIPYNLSSLSHYKNSIFEIKKILNLKEYFDTIYNNNDLDLGIAIGKLSDASEVYINGYKISEVGKKGPFLFSAYNFYQYYRIPFYLIGEDNLLEIKIVLYVKTNASLTDKILISNYDLIYYKAFFINFFNFYFKIFLFIFLLLLFVLFLLIGISERRKELVYFSFSSLIVAFFSVNQIIKFLPIDYLRFNYFIIYKALYLIGILLILFFSEYSKIKINKLMKFIIYFFLFSFFIDLIIFNNYRLRKNLYNLELFIGLIAYFYIIYFYIKASFKKENENLKKFRVPLIILMLSLINDIFVFTFPSKYPQFYTMIYGFEFLLIIIAKDLIVEIISIYKDVLSKNSSLTFKNKELNLYIEKIETIRTYLINNHDIYKKISLVIKDLSNNLSSTVSQFTAHIEEIVTTNNYIYENEGEAIKNIDNQLRLIDDIREKLNDFINLFNEIDQNIKNVKDFAENIENISKQTNLLGLNASIEASRGGDFSKEFTVVANEVKNLASKSTALSNSINENVKKLLDYMVKGSINSKTLNKNFEDLNYSFNQFYNIIKKNRELSDILFEKFNTISNLINDFSDISSLLASESENLIL